MTSFLTISICIAIITFTLLGILLIYNGFSMLYWIRKNSNTEYEHRKATGYKKKIIITSSIMVIVGLIVYLYKSPVNFEKLMGSKDYSNKVESICLMRTNTGISEDKTIIDKKEIEDILNSLEKYRYVRNLQNSVLGNIRIFLENEQFMVLSLASSGNHYLKTFNISSSGYIIDAYTGQAYKVKTENGMDFFKKLNKSLSDKE